MGIPKRLISLVPNRAMPLLRRAWCWWQGRGDVRYIAETGHDFLPPATLRFHVGSVERESFVRVGQSCVADLTAALSTVGRELSGFGQILDFGCGCGRTLVWLRECGPQLFGCDLHEQCIDWCKRNLNFGDFRTNDVCPPLAFDDGAFDLIYAISVFTHLDEQDQFHWLRELERVTRPGAIVLLSVHGRSAHDVLDPAEKQQLEQSGILVKEAHALWGVFAKYFNTYHQESYVRERWSDYFDVRGYLPRGMNNHQDLVVLERR